MHKNVTKSINKPAGYYKKNKNSHWFCIIYAKDFLPIFDLNNDEFVHTIKGKKIKFTHVTKKKLTAETGFFQQIYSF